jgi:hypothetical protein
LRDNQKFRSDLESVKLKTFRDVSAENGRRSGVREINKSVKESWDESKENDDVKSLCCMMRLATDKPKSLFDRLQVIQIYCFLTLF